MHTEDALKLGETQRRLNLVAAWWEAPTVFNDRERAALALTESVTLISKDGVPDRVWDDAIEQFDDQDLTALLMAIVAINGWNRLAVATHKPLRS